MKKKEKIEWAVIGGVVLAVGVFLLLREGEKEENSLWIARPESGTEKYALSISVEDRNEEWDFTVNPREKTPEEAEHAFSETVRILRERLGIREEETLEVTKSLVLPEYIDETETTLHWNSSEDTVVSKDGKVHREQLQEPREVYLQARMRFGNAEREHWFTVKVLPLAEDSPEAKVYRAKEVLENLERDTSFEDGFYLPENVGEVTLEFSETSGSVPGLIPVAVLVLPFLILLANRQEKEKEKRKKEEDLLTAYPQLITKLTLYTGAGLSLRGAWERMAAEYRVEGEQRGKRSAIGDEVLILAGELKNGATESRSYENFGKRIGLKPYLRCGTLCASQVQKGSTSLRKGLETEVGLAWELYRERAVKKGEEAQTKLLFPMMGMLFLVMAVIMIPAFFSM